MPTSNPQRTPPTSPETAQQVKKKSKTNEGSDPSETAAVVSPPDKTNPPPSDNPPNDPSDKPSASPSDPSKDTNLDSPEPPDDMIPTTLVTQFHKLTAQLSEEDTPKATKPFKTFTGNGPTALQGPLKEVQILLGKCYHNQATLSKEQMDNLFSPGPSKEDWLMFFQQVSRNKITENSILSDSDILNIKIFISRLAHTNPGKIVKNIKRNKMPPNHTSRAWWAAVQAIGSWYAKDLVTNRKKNGDLRNWLGSTTKPAAENPTTPTSDAHTQDHQTPPSGRVRFADQPPAAAVTPASPATTPSNNNADAPPSGNTTTNGNAEPTDTTTTRDTAANSATVTNSPPSDTAPGTTNSSTSSSSRQTNPSGPNAKTILANRTHQVRVNFKIEIPKDHGAKGANEYFLELIANFLEYAQDNDKSLALLPWTDRNLEKLFAILHQDHVPTKIADFKVYSDRARPKVGTNWIKLRFATNGKPDDVTSNDNSNNSDWFDSHSVNSYLLPVQGSAETTSLGDFLYSGPYLDVMRLQQEILRYCKALDGKDYRLGLRLRKNKEIRIDDLDGRQVTGPRVWTMAANQTIHIEVDRTEAKILKKHLYHLFNKQKTAHTIPGGHLLRLLPDKTLMRSGPDGNNLRIAALKKHVAHNKSKTLITAEDIRSLESPIPGKDGKSRTLRTFLLQDITYPLVTLKEGDETTPMFNTVDKATTGQDAQHGITYLTAYNDRATMAEKVALILPALVNHLLGMEAVRAWFHPTALEFVHGVDFGLTIGGEWDGTWSTPDDDLHEEFLNEDVGFAIDFDPSIIRAAAAADEQIPAVLLNADDASVATFGSAYGVSGSPAAPLQPSEQEPASGSPPADDAAAMQVSGGDSD